MSDGIRDAAKADIEARRAALGTRDENGEIAQRVEEAGTKYDGGKPRMELLATEALRGTAQVLTFGAKKYDDNNWRKGMSWSRLYGALLRHLAAWNEGEDLDPESGLPHLDHAACCVMFLQSYSRRGAGKDDRYVG